MNTFIITKPIITERAADLTTQGKYVFMVKPEATKSEVKKAIHAIYKVDVKAVNIINLPAKARRYRGRSSQTTGYKKAVVTLKSGQKIEVQ